MHRYRDLLAFALAMLFAMQQAGMAVAGSVPPQGAHEAMAPCPDCPGEGARSTPIGLHELQCAAHCAASAQVSSGSTLVIPPPTFHEVRCRPQEPRPGAAAATQFFTPGQPPPKRILYQSFQI